MTYQELKQQIADAGVVGAGGAGFPTDCKLIENMDYFIINGAECEPLLYTDQMIMDRNAELLVATLQHMIETLHIGTGIIALKEKHKELIEKLQQVASNYPAITIKALKNIYPAGDEITLIYECTGIVIPKGQLPSTKKVIECNVETLLNIGEKLSDGKSVTTTHLTVSGAVDQPLYVEAPLGISIGTLLQILDIKLPTDSHILLGGPMMGRFVDASTRIEKTTKGILILPKDHEVFRLSQKAQLPSIKRVMSSCSQCRMCTDLCPRNRLGHKVEPHKLMNAFANGALNHAQDVVTALGCCGCKLCSNYSCHHGLNPGELMTMMRKQLLAKGIRPQLEEPTPGRMVDMQVPASRLLQRLGLTAYDKHPIAFAQAILPDRVKLGLRQHIGMPAIPVVKEGDSVQVGQLLAKADSRGLSASIHASIEGVVTQITETDIIIERRSVG